VISLFDEFQPLSVKVGTREIQPTTDALHSNRLVSQVLASRGIVDADQVELALSGLPRPDLLPNIDLAVQRLLKARLDEERILIVGDYDCDGATSTAVAMTGLAQLGFTEVDYLIPNRFEHGYGLSPAIVDIAQARKRAGH